MEGIVTLFFDFSRVLNLPNLTALSVFKLALKVFGSKLLLESFKRRAEPIVLVDQSSLVASLV